MFPWECTFPVSLRQKKKKMRAANYSCYLGYCRKIVFSDIFFVLIFFGPEWEINSFSVSSVKIGNYIFKKRKKEIFYTQPFIGKSL